MCMRFIMIILIYYFNTIYIYIYKRSYSNENQVKIETSNLHKIEIVDIIYGMDNGSVYVYYSTF